MHALQPKQIKLKEEDVKALLSKYNIALSQLPKVSIKDPGIPEGCEIGDVLQIERKTEEGTREYFRVVV